MLYKHIKKNSLFCFPALRLLPPGGHRSFVLQISPTFTGNLWLNLRRPEAALPHSLTNTVEPSTPMMLQSASLKLSAALHVSRSHSHFMSPNSLLTFYFMTIRQSLSPPMRGLVYLIHIFPLNTLYLHRQLCPNLV